MRIIYLHLGFHKTATTFLQKFIYPKMKQVNYIKLNKIRNDLRRVRHKSLSDLQIENIRDYFNSFNNGQPMLISYEGLSGSPFAPRKSKSQLRILEDLRRIYPDTNYDVRVIVSIREQVDLLTSLYIEQLHQGGTMTAEAYINYCKRNGSINNFQFFDYLQKIEDIFGNNQLYVMVYEHFKQNSENEMSRLLNFMGEPEIPNYTKEQNMRKMNKSYGTMQIAIARQLNRFFKTPIHPQGRLAIIKPSKKSNLPPRRLLQNRLSYAIHYKRYEFPEDLQSSLKERYIDGNKQLVKKYNLNLPNTYF